MKMTDQVIKFDILRNDPEQIEIIGEKTIKVVKKTEMLNHNNWIKRPSLKDKVPTLPLSNYKGVGTSRCLTNMQRGCFGFLYSNANDIQQSLTGTALYSASFGAGHGIFVNQENFDKIMMTFAVRRIAVGNVKWTADCDQFTIPHTLTDEFTNDCIMWSLTNGSNSTSTLKDFPHEGKDYTVKNEFFPFKHNQVTTNWKSTKLGMPDRTTHCATVLSDKIAKGQVSSEARALYDALLAYYQVTIEHIKELPLLFRGEEYLTSWDLGYRQIQSAYDKLKELGKVDGSEQKKVKELSKVLEKKILPKIYEYGFLPTEKWYE